jgi:hypothetical protein
VIGLLIMLSIMAGMLVGWSGHKASLRIRTWGLRMNEQDEIFREAGDSEGRGSERVGRGRPESPLGSHLPLGTAGLK